MGNSLEGYRAAIGLFQYRRKRSDSFDFRADLYNEILLTNLRCCCLFIALVFLQSLNPNVNIVFILSVLHFILIIGNIESNPGPITVDVSSAPLFHNVSENTVSVCNLNIRSIRNKIEFLQNFVDEFDIVTITESHLDCNIDTSDIELESFSKHPMRKDRSKAGGGLLIYTKDDVTVEQRNEFENDIDETLWVQIRAKGHTFLLCNTYRPEWTDSDYWARLNHAIGMASQLNENIVILGDLNSDLLIEHNNKLLYTMQVFNFKNIINKPTRVTDHSSTLLDPIIISDTMECLYSDVLKLPSNISDHDASVAFIKCPRGKSHCFKRKIWLYDKMDVNKFSNKIEGTDWHELLGNDTNVDDMCVIFTKFFLEIAKDCIPTKIITVRNNDKPWFNHTLRKEIRARDRIRGKVLKFNRDVDIQMYKKQRNKVNNLKKIAKENFENNLDNILLENSSNPKTYWKIMKMLIKSNKGSYNIPPLQNIVNDQNLGDTVYEDKDKCELLNKYFSLISKLEEENVPLPDFESKTNSIITDINVEINEIVDVIRILDPNKASGPDMISHKMLKICPEKIAIPLQIMFNKSLQQCTYPSDWKLANVTAIFKKGICSLPSNYRPISLISCVGKLMERVVYKHVYNHLQMNKLIYEYQSGFLPKHSTVHQLLEIYNSILNVLENKEIICFVFCDFSKAFDKVWHRGLLHKMNSYGIKGNLLNWFKSYLLDRKQRVVIKNSESSLSNVSAGVPQGSVLGPFYLSFI